LEGLPILREVDSMRHLCGMMAPWGRIGVDAKIAG
jgi:hypothetical protein